MKVNDYIVVSDKPGDRKAVKHLVKIIRMTNSGIEGLDQKEPHLKKSHVTIEDRSQILVNLGANPDPGMVYGFEVGDRYLRSVPHDRLGNLHYFMKPTKEMNQDLLNSIDRIIRKFDKLGLGLMFEIPVSYELRHTKGKYAGMFYRSSNEAKKPHRLDIFPDAVSDETSFDYIVAHELGHLLHMVVLASCRKLNADWIRLYNQTVKPRVIEKATLKSYADTLASSEGEFRDILKSSFEEEDGRSNIKLLLRYIKQVHSLSLSNLDDLWNNGNGRDDVIALIPRTSLLSKDIQPAVTEYATKNVEETFAESLALTFTGRKIPKAFSALLEESFSLAKIQLKNRD